MGRLPGAGLDHRADRRRGAGRGRGRYARRQLAATVAWQATVAAIVGCAVGIPLGIALGRWLWTAFARQIYAVPQPAVPVISIIVLPLCAVALVKLVAALPGRSAARTPAALALRAE